MDTEVEHRIPDGPTLLIRDGDDLTLNCLINFVPVNWDSSYVFWFHDKQLLNYESSGRAHIRIDQVKNGSGDYVLSKLQIRRTDQSDSGNYSCQLNAPSLDSSRTRPAHVQVFVLDDREYYASVSQGMADGSRLNPAKSWSSSAAPELQQRLLFSLLALHSLIIPIPGCLGWR